MSLEIACRCFLAVFSAGRHEAPRHSSRAFSSRRILQAFAFAFLSTVAWAGVTLTPASVTLAPSATQTFTASEPVTWSLDAGDLAYDDTSADYTAAYNGEGLPAGTYTLTATSQADSSQSATATITVTGGPLPSSLVVSPASATLVSGAQATFTANQPVTWSVDAGSYAYNDTMAQFTAAVNGSNLPSGTYTLTATSQADASQVVQVAITVSGAATPPPSLALTPSTVTLQPGASQVFTANQPVTWSASAGALSYSNTRATFTAAVNGSNLPPGTYTLTATSQADAAQSVTATITVPEPSTSSVSLTPSAATVQPGASQVFTANQPVTWSVSAGNLSYSSTRATFTAVASGSNLPPGTYTLTATSAADTTQRGTAVITIPEPAPVSVTVSPARVTLAPNASQAFLASVQNGTSSGVIWTVVGGHLNGSISPSGLFTAASAPGVYSVMATSVADPAKSSSASVTVQVTTPIRLTLSPTEATLAPGATQVFQLSSTGWNGNLSYQYSSSGGALAPGADGAFTFTAPSQPGDVTLTFKIPGTDEQVMGIVHVVAPPAGVSVSIPQSAVTLAPNATHSFTATVVGSANGAVTWSVQGGDASGSIDDKGAYTAPDVAGTYTLVATSVADPTKAASAMVTVPVTISLDPGSATVDQGANYGFAANVSGTQDTSVTWTSVPSGITWDSYGAFTVPATPGVYTVTATSVADPSQSASATVTVPPIAIKLSATTLSLPAGAVVNLVSDSSGKPDEVVATVTGTIHGEITWSIVSGGGAFAPKATGSTSRVFDTPYSPGTCVLKATSLADPSQTALLTVTVTANPNPVIRTFTANPPRIPEGARTFLVADFGNGQGVVTPGAMAMTTGTALPVSPAGSTKYSLGVTSANGAKTEQSLSVAVTGPGAVSHVQDYPSHFMDYFDLPGAPIHVVVTRDGSVLGIGCRSTFGSGDLNLYRFDMATQTWSPSGVLAGQGKVIRFGALALPDGNVVILTTLSADSGGQRTTLKHISSIYLLSPTGVVLASKDIGVSNSFGINGSLSLLPDGRLIVAGGEFLPNGVTFCNNGLDCDEPKNWITYIDPMTLVIANPTITLNHARANQSAVLLQDGRILFVGGGSPVLEMFDPAAQTCTDVGTLHASTAQAVMQGDGRVLCLGAGPEEHALFDPSNLSLTFVPDGTADPGFNPRLLSNGLVLANLRNSDLSLWDPTKQVRLGTQNPSDAVYFDLVSIDPTLLPDGTILGGSYSKLARFDPQPTLKISPAFVQENAGRVIPFQVANPNGASITWSSSGGTVDDSGHFTALTPGTYVVTATASDGRKTLATVNSWPKVRVVITPLPTPIHASGKNWLQPGDSIQLTGMVRNHPDQAISWSVPSGTTGVSITPSGLLTALAPGKCTILATPEADPTQVGSLVVQVWPADLQPPKFISASAAPLDMNEQGGPLAVTWQLSTWGLEEGAYDIGIVDTSVPGSYVPLSGTSGVCPVPPGSGLGNGESVTHYFALRASNPAGTTQANFIVHVHGEYLRIVPSEMSIRPGQSQQFSYVLQYDPQTPRVNWTAVKGGSVNASGIYTAPMELGYYNLQATSADNPAITALAKITVADPAITISPTVASLYPGEQMRFGYSLTGTPATDVYWSSTGGVANPGGDYQAPTSDGNYTVTVYGPDHIVSATAKVTVKPITIHLSPSSQTLPVGSSLQFAYSTDFGGLTWSATGGTISATGLYTPPTTPGTYKVTATSTSAFQYSVSASVTVSAPALSISPSTVALPQGGTFQFNYSCSSGAVNWSASGGSINADGTYTAPSSVGTYTVTATSALDPGVSASATVTVTLSSEKKVVIAPGVLSLFPGASSHFSAAVQGLSDASVTWSIVEVGGGAVDSTGAYVAPSMPGTYTVKATSVQDPTLSGAATVQVSPVVITPQASVLLAPLFTHAFAATLAPGASGPITWSIDEGPSAGQISTDGLYTAPPTNGIVHVRATLPGGGSDSVEVDIGQIKDVVIGVPVQVTQAGAFNLSADLIGSNGKTVSASLACELPSGTSTPELTFPAKEIHDLIGVDGPWTVGNVRLDYLDPLTGDTQEADQKDNLGATQSWSLGQLQQPWASLSGAFSFSGVKDGSGALFGVQANVGVKLLAPGTYTVFALLDDASGNEVACSGPTDLTLPSGTATITLAFPGSAIKASGANGPYTVTGFVVAGQESNAFQDVGVITGFNAGDFQ